MSNFCRQMPSSCQVVQGFLNLRFLFASQISANIPNITVSLAALMDRILVSRLQFDPNGGHLLKQTE